MGHSPEAPSDIKRKAKARSKALGASAAFLAGALAITGLTWGGMAIQQGISNNTINGPLTYQTVDPQPILKDSSQKSYNWDRKYSDVGSKIESLDYDVTVMEDGKLDVKNKITIRLDEQWEDDYNRHVWSQVFYRIPISPDGYKSIQVKSARNVSGDYNLEKSSYANPDDYSDNGWDSNQAGKWWLGKFDDSDASIRGDFKTGDSGTAVLGANIKRTTSGSVDLEFNYVLTPGEALQNHPNGMTTELFSVADTTKSGDSAIKKLNVTIHRPKTTGKRSAWIKLPESTDPSWEITPNKINFSADQILFNEIPSAVISVPTSKLNLPDDVASSDQTAEDYAESKLMNGKAFAEYDGTVQVGDRISMADAKAKAAQQTMENKRKAQENKEAAKRSYEESLKNADHNEALVNGVSALVVVIALLMFLAVVLNRRLDNRRKMNDIKDVLAEDPSDLRPFYRQVLTNMMVNGQTRITDLNLIDSSMAMLTTNPVIQTAMAGINPKTSTWFDRINKKTKNRKDDSRSTFSYDPVHVYPGPSVVYSDVPLTEMEAGLPAEQVDSIVDLTRRDGVNVDSTVTIVIDHNWYANDAKSWSSDLDFIFGLLNDWYRTHDKTLMFDLDELVQFYQNVSSKNSYTQQEFYKLRDQLEQYVSGRVYKTRRSTHAASNDNRMSHESIILPAIVSAIAAAMGVTAVALSPGLIGVGMLKGVFSIGALAASISWIGSAWSTDTVAPTSLTEAISIADRNVDQPPAIHVPYDERKYPTIISDQAYLRVGDKVLYDKTKQDAINNTSVKIQDQNVPMTSQSGR